MAGSRDIGFAVIIILIPVIWRKIEQLRRPRAQENTGCTLLAVAGEDSGKYKNYV